MVQHHSTQKPRNKGSVNSKATGQKDQYEKVHVSLSSRSSLIQLINNNTYFELNHEVVQPFSKGAEQEAKCQTGEKQLDEVAL